MKENANTIEYKGKTYNLCFNFNVMQQIQEEYGAFAKWADLTDGEANHGEANMKAVIFGITAMINEGIDIENEEQGTDVKPMTTKQVGRMITAIGLESSVEKMNSTVVESTQSAEKNA